MRRSQRALNGVVLHERMSSGMRFTGRIVGFGTTSGVRIVVGVWHDSPFGAFADAMIERPDGERLLLAPNDDVADLVSTTYSFDSVDVLPFTAAGRGRTLQIRSARLTADVGIGRVSTLGLLLRMIPRPVAQDWRWAAAIDPVARILVPGARTAGSAGGDRREYYGVSDARAIAAVDAELDGTSLGALAPLSPAPRFGFASTPATPTMVDVTTTIR